MIRVVIDTSTVVSAVISPAGPNAQVLTLVADDEIRPYATEAVLLEYERAFKYERLKHLDRRRVANVLRLIKAAAIKVKSAGRLKLSPDEKDNRIYECAAAAKAHYNRYREHPRFSARLQVHQNRQRPPTAGPVGKGEGKR